jgi:hypothetical protein
MSEPEEIEQAMAEAFRAMARQQWDVESARAVGDALVWMGYAVWRENPAGEPVLHYDREKFIVAAAAGGYYGDAGREEFLGKRGREYMEYLDQQEEDDDA